MINFGTSADLCENIVHYYVAYFDLTLELVTKLLKVFAEALVKKKLSIHPKVPVWTRPEYRV